MSAYLSNPWWAAFYVLGVLSASLHLGNGLFGFAVNWGLVPGARGQRLASWAGGAVFLVLTFVGLNSLFAFTGRSVRVFNHPEAHVESVAGAESGR